MPPPPTSFSLNSFTLSSFFVTFARMINRETIDRIYATADIVEVISDYVTLKRKGASHMACCPFHNEKTPSFVVSQAKGLFKCFGCGKGGNAVTFVMEHENVTYPEALKIVAKKYGIEVQEREMTEEEIRHNDDRESMFTLNSWVADYFANYLHRSDEGISVGMTYFRQARGFSEATIKKFGLGMCPSKGDKMTQDAFAAGYKEQFLLSTGLSIKRESDGRIYDRFRERVMFPVHNISGRIVAFGGRTLRTDKSVAKYQNSPESEIYSKKNELYGLYFSKKAIQQLDYAIMVEGYTDVISMHQSGVENVVASSGTSLTIEQIRLLKRFTRNVTIIYDGDSAGIHASLRGIDLVLREGMNVRIVLLPENEDPDSFARSHSATEVQNYIAEHQENFITFKAKLLLSSANNDPIKRSECIADIVQSIVQIPDNIQRSMFIKECSRLMEIDENILIGEVAQKRVMSVGDTEAAAFLRRQQQLARQNATPAPTQPNADHSARHISAGSSLEALEKELMLYLLKHGESNFEVKEGSKIVSINVASTIIDELVIDGLSFSNPIFNRIFEFYRTSLQEGHHPTSREFVNNHDPEICSMAVTLLTADDNYTESTMWVQKEVHIASDSEILAAGVPKTVILFKTKAITAMIETLHKELQDESLDEAQQEEITLKLANLNRARVIMSRRSKRVII